MNVLESQDLRTRGRWMPEGGATRAATPAALSEALGDLSRPFVVVEKDGRPTIGTGGRVEIDLNGEDGDGLPLLAHVPALRVDQLGDRRFRESQGLRYAYVAGAMANGIASAEIVEAMGEAGMIGFFGAAGLSPERVEQTVLRLNKNLGDKPWGSNLIHTPGEPEIERRVVDIYLRHKVRLLSASAYMGLTLPLVRYRLAGIHEGPNGEVVTPNRLVAKVSRIEVARKFFAPAPEALVSKLVAEGHLSAAQAELAKRVPVAQDLTAEADSGGHTDNRPALALIPTMIALADRMTEEHGYAEPLRVGAAGGISTPESAAAAFAMGAAYVLTGSVNQACVEAGTSDPVRKMLAEAEQADCAMAPAADMFELGVKLQVLKRGTMFAMKAGRLYDIYKAYSGLETIPAKERGMLEKQYFRSTLEEAWASTRAFWQGRDPSQVTKADRDPKHRMALTFRAYLGLSSRWANSGEPGRQIDYQIWCGPSMGAFNEWARGSVLEAPENRKVVPVALNILYGAATLLRAQMLRNQGHAVPLSALRRPPQAVSAFEQHLT